MRGFLEDTTYRIVNAIMRKNAKESFAYNRELQKLGGLAACSRRQAKKIVGIFYDITFKEWQDCLTSAPLGQIEVIA